MVLKINFIQILLFVYALKYEMKVRYYKVLVSLGSH